MTVSQMAGVSMMALVASQFIAASATRNHREHFNAALAFTAINTQLCIWGLWLVLN